MSQVTFITGENFETEVVQSQQPVVVEFWTEGCAPCQKLGRVIRNYAGRMRVAACNVDENPELADRFGVLNIPSLLFFKNGEVVDVAIGYINDISEAEVAAKCEAVLAT